MDIVQIPEPTPPLKSSNFDFDLIYSNAIKRNNLQQAHQVLLYSLKIAFLLKG